jgi:hypothetical protein
MFQRDPGFVPSPAMRAALAKLAAGMPRRPPIDPGFNRPGFGPLLPAPHPPSRYRLPGPQPGMISSGNIDILKRALLHVPNPHGGFSSVYSTSFAAPKGYPNAGREVLIPRVIHQNGRWQVVSPQQAWQYYLATGKNLGVFQNPAAANRYARLLHLQQAGGR